MQNPPTLTALSRTLKAMPWLTVAAAASLLTAAPAQAQATHLSEPVRFDCAGAIERVVTFNDGSRTAVGAVRLTVQRASGPPLIAGGLIVLRLAPVATGNPGTDHKTRKLSRCVGQGLLTGTLTQVQHGIPIYDAQIAPDRVQIQSGKLRIDNPADVGVTTEMGGNPDG